MIKRDGHVHVLPLHVANKIAAGEVVERPASVVKELVENAIDAGAQHIRINISQGGRKLIAVQDDGSGMTREDAVLSLERQATSKILDVDDIEQIDTLGFRGEAIPSIAAVSRFTITTRRHDSDEGTAIEVNAGAVADIRAAGCPPGTLVEVRDLFCNIPARRKFLRAYATEESHVRQIFAVHALANPAIGFVLTVDGREVYRLSGASNLADRILDLFGKDFFSELLPVENNDCEDNAIVVRGFVERPNLNAPTRRDQYIFVNGRAATAPSIAYALKEAYPRRAGEVRPAAILFIDLPPSQVDVNVHPTKREVRFRNNAAVKAAIVQAIQSALTAPRTAVSTPPSTAASAPTPSVAAAPIGDTVTAALSPAVNLGAPSDSQGSIPSAPPIPPLPPKSSVPLPQSVPTQVEFAVDPDSTASRPWQWFKFLAITSSNYLLIETDAGIVTVNPRAACERIAYEQLIYARPVGSPAMTQALLIPEIVRLSPGDSVRLKSSLSAVSAMGFQIEEFGPDTFKVDGVPQLLGNLACEPVLATIAQDLAESGIRRGERWREELIAKSIAKSFAGASKVLTQEGALSLMEDLSRCRMPYVCPRGKSIMIFTSTRELNRKFSLD